MDSYLRIALTAYFNMSFACVDEARCRLQQLAIGDGVGPPPPPFYTGKNKREQVKDACIVLAITMLILIFFAVLCHYRCQRRRRRNSMANGEFASGREDDDGDIEDTVGDGGLHHVWYIRTVGLDQNTIDSIKIFPYKFDDPLIGTTNCSVCLSEFREAEHIRLLPKCSHAFHISCIDTWLRSHVNCPLCRAPVVVAPLAAAAAAITTPLASSSSSASSSSTVTSSSEESYPVPSEDRQNPQLQTNVVATENSGSRNPIARDRSNSVSAIAFPVLRELSRRGGQRTASNGVDSITIAAPHRSFSMDFSAMGAATEGNAWQERKGPRLGLQVPSRVGIMEKQWSGRKGTRSLGMVRSASTNGGGGGKLFGSRLGRGRSNSVLPL